MVLETMEHTALVQFGGRSGTHHQGAVRRLSSKVGDGPPRLCSRWLMSWQTEETLGDYHERGDGFCWGTLSYGHKTVTAGMNSPLLHGIKSLLQLVLPLPATGWIEYEWNRFEKRKGRPAIPKLSENAKVSSLYMIVFSRKYIKIAAVVQQNLNFICNSFCRHCSYLDLNSDWMSSSIAKELIIQLCSNAYASRVP